MLATLLVAAAVTGLQRGGHVLAQQGPTTTADTAPPEDTADRPVPVDCVTALQYCAGLELTKPDHRLTGAGASSPDLGEGEPGEAPRTPVPCTWVHWTDAGEAFPVIPDPPSAEAELYLRQCDGVNTGEVEWREPGDPPPGTAASPRSLAEVVRVRLEGSLPAPEVASDPAVGVASVVNVPVFVAVANWTAVVEDRECDPTGALCVVVRATPSLTWTPGEPGAPTLSCAGSGSRYDPAGPSMAQQAQGACAYAFTRRTGVEGRPDAWAGTVSVTWDLTWRDGTGLVSGTLAPVTRSVSVPRSVAEVQAVVTDVG